VEDNNGFKQDFQLALTERGMIRRLQLVAMNGTGRNACLAVALLLWGVARTVLGWGDGHEKINRAAFEVQPQALKALWSTPYRHPHDTVERPIREYLFAYCWWAGNPDHVEGPVDGACASEVRKNYVKQFVYGERNGTYGPPTPYGLPVAESGAVWAYHYFGFPAEETRARAERGARWYFDRMTEAFRDGRPEDAAQYAGGIAHAIEDRASTVHAWDGYGEQRQKMEKQHKLDSALKHGRSVFWFVGDQGIEAEIKGYRPRMLGGDSAEAARELAARLEELAGSSQAILSNPEGYLGAHLQDDWENGGSGPATDAAMSAMAKESARLVADMFFTAYRLANPAR